MVCTDFPQFRPASMARTCWLCCGPASRVHASDMALASCEVCDINPDRIHVTLPKGRRIRRRGGELYVVHHEDLAPERIGWWQQIPTVTLPTAIAQCITNGVPGYLMRQALTGARSPRQLWTTSPMNWRHGMTADDLAPAGLIR